MLNTSPHQGKPLSICFLPQIFRSQHRCVNSYLPRRINQSESEKLLSCRKTVDRHSVGLNSSTRLDVTLGKPTQRSILATQGWNVHIIAAWSKHHRNTKLTSIPLVSKRRYGNVNSVKLEMKFHPVCKIRFTCLQHLLRQTQWTNLSGYVLSVMAKSWCLANIMARNESCLEFIICAITADSEIEVGRISAVSRHHASPRHSPKPRSREVIYPN